VGDFDFNLAYIILNVIMVCIMIVFNDTYFIMLFIARAHIQTELVCV
jgi:hypothetical protein